MALTVRLDPYEIATIGASLDSTAVDRGEAADLGPRAEIAEPVYSDYWLHNKGAAPMGYQAVTVQIKPSFLGGEGPYDVPVVVASERTVGATAGSVSLVVPPGWEATPPERIYRLAPGAHLAFDAKVRPAAGASPGRYFVAARIVDDAGQRHEDVVTIDHRPAGDGTNRGAPTSDRSAALEWAVERAMAVGGVEPASGETTHAGARHDLGGELIAELRSGAIAVAVGDDDVLSVSLRNLAASEIRGEAQILSPLETWSAITPWTQGFAVGPGGETTVGFRIAPPPDAAAGTYWGLVKVMYFGRLHYTDSVPIKILAPLAASVLDRAGTR